MIDTQFLPGNVILHCCKDNRFKQGCLSIQFLLPLCRDESALNALIPAILLRGSQQYPDILSITSALDDLYGSGIGALARKYRNCYGTGFYISFLEDRFAMQNEQILFPLLQMAKDIIFNPVGDGNSFRPDIVESEKANLISAIESRKNNKASYAMHALIESMCCNDPSGTQRLGTIHDVAAITPESAFAHYQKMLTETPISIFYVGSMDTDAIIPKVLELFSMSDRCVVALPQYGAFIPSDPKNLSEKQSLSQSHLCMGFLTPITLDHALYPAMQLLNIIYGSGMTSKLFMNVREKKSLCYSISSVYTAGNGILTVYAGIDHSSKDTATDEILHQLDLCCKGEISDEEITAGKEAFYSTLASIMDSPSALENYFTAAIQNEIPLDTSKRIQAMQNVTLDDLMKAAQSLKLHSTFFLEGDAS